MTKEQIIISMLLNPVTQGLFNSAVASNNSQTAAQIADSIAQGAINELGSDKTESEYTEHIYGYIKNSLL